ncbi:anthrone oxygenase family protein [Rhizobium binxianense]
MSTGQGQGQGPAAAGIASFATGFLAVLALGIMTGFFFAFSNPVMPAFRQLEADIFVDAFNSINVSVRNGVFFAAFFAPLPLLLVAALLDGRARLMWLAALVVYAIVVVQTRMINVPINELFKAITAAPPANWEELRDRWALSNIVRTLLTALAFSLSLFAAIRSAARTRMQPS